MKTLGFKLLACCLAGSEAENQRITAAIATETASDAREIFGDAHEAFVALSEASDPRLLTLSGLHQMLRARNIDKEDGNALVAEVSLEIDRVQPAELLWSQIVADARNQIGWRHVESVNARLEDACQRREGDPLELLAKVANVAPRITKAIGLTGKRLVASLIDDVQERYDRNKSGRISGISTGFRELDSLTGGLQFGELAIIGARPSAGTSALMVNIVVNACIRDGVPTTILSLEMSVAALARRMASDSGNIPAGHLKNGTMTEPDFKALTVFNGRLGKAPLTIHDSRDLQSIDAALAEMRRNVDKGVRLFCIDYIQKLKPSGTHEKRTYEVGEVSNLLQNFAQNHKVAVLCLAQLNRAPDQDKGRKPRLSDLADSAQLERDGDLIALIHRPRFGTDRNGDPIEGTKAALLVAKSRDGEIGEIPLRFNGAFCRFENGD